MDDTYTDEMKELKACHENITKAKDAFDVKTQNMKDQIVEYFQFVDTNNDGKIDLKEFLSKIVEIYPSLNTTNLRKALKKFDIIDINNSKYISMNEITKFVFKMADVPFDEENTAIDETSTKLKHELQSQRIETLEKDLEHIQTQINQKDSEIEHFKSELEKTNNQNIDKLDKLSTTKNEEIQELRENLSKKSELIASLESENKDIEARLINEMENSNSKIQDMKKTSKQQSEKISQLESIQVSDQVKRPTEKIDFCVIN